MRGATFGRENKFGQNLKNSDSPGPGQYTQVKETLTKSKSSPSYSQNKSPMFYEVKTPDLGPSPNSYTPQKTNFKTQGFYGSGRYGNALYNFNKNPGPGSYSSVIDNNYKFNKSTSQTMRGKQNIQVENTTPGPNNYKIRNSVIENKTGCKFGNENRLHSRLEPQQVFTGPGSYQGRSNSVKPAQPNYSMGRSKRNDLIMSQVIQSPGPGSYAIIPKQRIGYMEKYEKKD